MRPSIFVKTKVESQQSNVEVISRSSIWIVVDAAYALAVRLLTLFGFEGIPSLDNRHATFDLREMRKSKVKSRKSSLFLENCTEEEK